MPLTTPLVPVLILVLGATVLALTKRMTGPRARDGLALFVTGSLFLFLLLLYRDQPTSVVIPLWGPLSRFGAELGYYVDNLSLLFASLIGLIVLVVILARIALRISDEESTDSYGAVFLVAAGGISLIFAADLITLYLSWGFLDLSLLFLTAFVHRGKAASRTGLRVLAINYLAGLALLGSLLLLQRQGDSFSLQAMFFPSKVISLTLFAALVRLGLYPTLVSLPFDVEMSLPAVVAWYAIPLSAGGYLLARVLILGSVTSLLGKEVAVFLGSLALILGPFPLWFETNLRRSASYIILHQVGYLALASAVTGPFSVVAVSTQVLSMALALSLLLVSHAAGRKAMPRTYRLWTQGCTFVGVATLVGTPFTIGFVSRWLLYRSLWESGLGPLIILSLSANSFLLAPLLKMFVERTPVPSEQARTSSLLLGAMSSLTVPLVVLGLYPPLIGRLVGAQSTASALPTLPDLLLSAPPLFAVIMIAGILLSLGLGYLMYRRGRVIVTRAGLALETLQTVAEMDWLYRASSWAVERLAMIVEQLGSFFEESQSMGWILLFALLVTLLLLSG